MAKSRIQVLAGLAKGLLAAIALTLVLMAATAVAAMFLRISDGVLTALNQLMKLAAILLGVRMAVGRGGERGFLTGMALAMLYMILGCLGYVLLGGGAISAADMLGEILIGAAVGAAAGAVLANLPAKGRRTRPA